MSIFDTAINLGSRGIQLGAETAGFGVGGTTGAVGTRNLFEGRPLGDDLGEAALLDIGGLAAAPFAAAGTAALGPSVFANPGMAAPLTAEEAFLSGSASPGAGGGLLASLGFGPGTGNPAGLGSVLNSPMAILTALAALAGSNRLKQAGQDSGNRADPWGPQRGRYQKDLNDLMMNPENIERIPGYQAGLNAVERRLAAQGYLGSGNMMLALAKQGGDFFNQYLKQLMELAGVNVQTRAGDLEYQGQRDAISLMGQGLNRMAYGIPGLGKTFGIG